MGENSSDPMKKIHAIVFPYPFQGHITPALHLAFALASRRGLSVTFVLTEFVHHAASKSGRGDDFFAGARESGLDISCATISDGFPLDFDRRMSSEFRESMIRDFPARADELIGRLRGSSSSSSSVSVLVVDSLCAWAAGVAEKHGLVNVSFWTEPATVFSINYHMDLLRENGHFPNYTGDGETDINYIPGVGSIKTKDLMSYIRHPHVMPGVLNIAVTAFEQVKNAHYILCNTVEELESEALSALNQKHPTYAIGPVNYSITNNVVHRNIVERISLWPKSDCTGWLNSKPRGSVLYISFGSIARISKHEIREIAHGLLLSRVNFLWVLRIGDDDGGDGLPAGFFDDVGDRGLVVPWCNQGVVLSSPALGGFLTHCGWNSVLESIWNGVPMICHPLLVDQPTNRKLVVDDWKVGVNLCDGEEVSREEFMEKMELIMKGKTSMELRKEINKLGEILRSALGKNGSSSRNLDGFVEDLRGRLQIA